MTALQLYFNNISKTIEVIVELQIKSPDLKAYKCCLKFSLTISTFIRLLYLCLVISLYKLSLELKYCPKHRSLIEKLFYFI